MGMDQNYSIAEAKDHFSELIREVEEGRAVKITRRGKTVAVLISETEYARRQAQRKPLDWGLITLDTRGWKFDREEANAR